MMAGEEIVIYNENYNYSVKVKMGQFLILKGYLGYIRKCNRTCGLKSRL